MHTHSAGRSLGFLCLVLAAAGCDTTVPVLTMDGGVRDSGGEVDDGGADAGDEDAGGHAPDPSTCVGFAELYCDWLARCFPFPFQIAHRGLLTDCVAQRAARCEYERGLPDAGDIADRAACLAATTASCSPPLVAPSCVPEPGGRGEGAPCRAHAQCGLASDGRRLRCVGASGGDCDDGTCQPALEEHAACVHGGMVSGLQDFGDPCDVDAGFRCVRAFVAAAPDRRADETTCELLRRGASGEPCARGTNYECRSPDLDCDGRIFECVAAPGAGEACSSELGSPICRLDQPIACDGSTCMSFTLRAAGEACAPVDLCPRPDSRCPASGVCPSDPAPGGACTADEDCAYYERCAGGACEVLVRPEC